MDEGLLKCLKVIIIYVIPKWRKDTKISWAELEVEGRIAKKSMTQCSAAIEEQVPAPQKSNFIETIRICITFTSHIFEVGQL